MAGKTVKKCGKKQQWMMGRKYSWLNKLFCFMYVLYVTVQFLYQKKVQEDITDARADKLV